jgi:hypothetical protein
MILTHLVEFQFLRGAGEITGEAGNATLYRSVAADAFSLGAQTADSYSLGAQTADSLVRSKTADSW